MLCSLKTADSVEKVPLSNFSYRSAIGNHGPTYVQASVRKRFLCMSLEVAHMYPAY